MVCAIAVYLGAVGSFLEAELRQGKPHSETGTLALLKRVLPRTRALADRGLLLRLGSG